MSYTYFRIEPQPGLYAYFRTRKYQGAIRAERWRPNMHIWVSDSTMLDYLADGEADEVSPDAVTS